MVTKVVPHFADLIDDITTIAKEDGYTEENLRAFKADPFTSSDPNILISYAKRAEMRKELAEYKQRVAELEKEPENVVKRIQEAGKRSATLTGRTTPSAGTKKGSDVSVSQISSMSDAELDEALNNA